MGSWLCHRNPFRAFDLGAYIKSTNQYSIREVCRQELFGGIDAYIPPKNLRIMILTYSEQDSVMIAAAKKSSATKFPPNQLHVLKSII
jgi:hypothetical protein